MNRRILMLASMLLTVSAASGQHYWGKTFLNPQPAGSLVNDNTFNWPAQHAGMHNEAKTRLGVSFFTEHSVNRGNIGTYFSPVNNNTFVVGSATQNPAPDVDGGYLVHDEQFSYDVPGGSPLGGTVTLKPERIVYGLQFEAQRNLDVGINGLSVRISVPIVNVQHKLNYTIANASPVTFQDDIAQTVTLENFFNGNVNVTNNGGVSAANIQTGLNYNRFKQEQSSSYFGDVRIDLCKELVNNGPKRATVYVEGILPTSKTPKSEFIFEPLSGNNGHFGLGIGIDGQAEMWHNNHFSIHAQAMGKFTYLFEATETRVLGLQNLVETGNTDSISNAYAHYAAAAPSSSASNFVLQPAANYLAEALKVRPGSSLEAGVQGRLAYKAFSFGLGYHLNWRDTESVWRKNATDDTAVIADKLTVTSSTISEYFPILAANITTDNARTPVQLNHTLSAQATYKPCVKACHNMLLSLGSSYQFSPDNNSLEQWGVWLSAGWAF